MSDLPPLRAPESTPVPPLRAPSTPPAYQAADLSLADTARRMLTIAGASDAFTGDDAAVVYALDLIADALAVVKPDTGQMEDVARDLELGFRAWATNLREDMAAPADA